MLRLGPMWVERNASLQSQAKERKEEGRFRAGQIDGVVNEKEEDRDEAADPPGSLRRRLHDPVCSPRLHHPQVLWPRWISAQPQRSSPPQRPQQAHRLPHAGDTRRVRNARTPREKLLSACNVSVAPEEVPSRLRLTERGVLLLPPGLGEHSQQRLRRRRRPHG